MRTGLLGSSIIIYLYLQILVSAKTEGEHYSTRHSEVWSIKKQKKTKIILALLMRII